MAVGWGVCVCRGCLGCVATPQRQTPNPSAHPLGGFPPPACASTPRAAHRNPPGPTSACNPRPSVPAPCTYAVHTTGGTVPAG